MASKEGSHVHVSEPDGGSQPSTRDEDRWESPPPSGQKKTGLDGLHLKSPDISLAKNLSGNRWFVAGLGFVGFGKCDRDGFMEKKNVAFHDAYGFVQFLMTVYRCAAYIVGHGNFLSPLRGVKMPSYGYYLKGETFNGIYMVHARLRYMDRVTALLKWGRGAALMREDVFRVLDMFEDGILVSQVAKEESRKHIIQLCNYFQNCHDWDDFDPEDLPLRVDDFMSNRRFKDLVAAKTKLSDEYEIHKAVNEMKAHKDILMNVMLTRLCQARLSTVTPRSVDYVELYADDRRQLARSRGQSAVEAERGAGEAEEAFGHSFDDNSQPLMPPDESSQSLIPHEDGDDALGEASAVVDCSQRLEEEEEQFAAGQRSELKKKKGTPKRDAASAFLSPQWAPKKKKRCPRRRMLDLAREEEKSASPHFEDRDEAREVAALKEERAGGASPTTGGRHSAATPKNLIDYL